MADQEKVDKLGTMVAKMKADLHDVENQITTGKYDEVDLPGLSKKLDTLSEHIGTMTDAPTKATTTHTPTPKATGHK